MTNEEKEQFAERRAMKNHRRILDAMYATGLFGVSRAQLEARLADQWICEHLEEIAAIGIDVRPKL